MLEYKRAEGKHMKIVWLQHASFEGPGYILEWALQKGHAMNGVLLCDNQPLPIIDSFDLLVVMGGPMGVYDTDTYPWLAAEKRFLRDAVAAGKPVLGICLGAQLLADALGAGIKKNRHREIGWFDIKLSDEARQTRLGRRLPQTFTAFHWHGDTFDIPSGAVHLASSAACANQGFIWNDRVIALQFHNEVTAASIQSLSQACGGELDGTRFVQNSAKITDPAPVKEANRVMAVILDAIAAGLQP